MERHLWSDTYGATPMERHLWSDTYGVWAGVRVSSKLSTER